MTRPAAPRAQPGRCTPTARILPQAQTAAAFARLGSGTQTGRAQRAGCADPKGPQHTESGPRQGTAKGVEMSPQEEFRMAAEEYIDQVSVGDLLALVEEVCRSKAQHIDENWQDRELAQAWRAASDDISRASVTHAVSRISHAWWDEAADWSSIVEGLPPEGGR